MTRRPEKSRYARISIGPTVMDLLHGFRQPPGAHEAGGILLGREYTGQNVMVEEISTPSNEDRSGPNWFDRSRERAQLLVNDAWKRSNGELIYLGEWHSHPEDVPRPSRRDREMIRNMLRQTTMEIDFLVLVVVGRAAIWVGFQTDSELTELSILPIGISTIATS